MKNYWRMVCGQRRSTRLVGFDTSGFENLLALRDVDECLRRTGWAQIAAA